MAAKANHMFLNLLIFLSIFIISKSETQDVAVADCLYTVYVQTGTALDAGTDSTISLTLYDADGKYIYIRNLKTWGGLMGSGYDYYERGNLDIFGGRGPCLTGPVCKMNLTSDGKGLFSGWNCNYVEVTTSGLHQKCAKIKFNVDQWLNSAGLTAIRNYCKKRVIDGYSLSLVSV